MEQRFDHQLPPAADPPPGSTVFDASQYAFFGGDVVDEVELGGLDDEEDDSLIAGAAGLEDEDFLLEKEEVGAFQSISDVDDLASSFSKINSEFNGSRGIGFPAERVSSGEGAYVGDWAQGNSNSWPAQRSFDNEIIQDGKRWPSNQFSSYDHLAERESLSRMPSYPEQQPSRPESLSSDSQLVRQASFISYPLPGNGSEQLLVNHHGHHLNLSYGPQMGALPQPNPSSASSNMQHPSQFNASSRPAAIPAQWENQSGYYPVGNASHLLQQSPPQNGSMNQLYMLQQRNLHQAPPSHGHLPGTQIPLRNSHPLSAPFIQNKFDLMHGSKDWRDHPHKLIQRGRQDVSQHGYDSWGRRNVSGWPALRSKFMTTDELENILRMQLAATHSNDPYVDDYYNQACLAKKAVGARFKHHFCPAQLREIPPGERPIAEPHAFLQVDALGRVPFSSIRRPRPLLEVDVPNSTTRGCNEPKANVKPLEQEPLLAARVMIEDGLNLLLDVDDIDRFLLFNQLHDGGAHLKHKRQNLIEEVAASLHLVDPLGKNGQSAGLTPDDDRVFMRLVSLPKGRKLLARYLQRLVPGDELIRIVCMAIFRHLRYLFGCLPVDPRAAETTANLATVVASTVSTMNIGALSACLAAVVCSSEQPPFRPIGSLAGDGASVVLKAVLEKATELLTDPRAAGSYNVANRALWQASFNEFFGLLTRYCMQKYDSVMQSLLIHAPGSVVGSEAARAISGEMPVDLLRASLPHTNEQQRKLLLDFAQRSMQVAERNN